MILLQAQPRNISPSDVKKRMVQRFPEIKSVHDFHIWNLTGSRVIVTCHIIIDSGRCQMNDDDYQQLSVQLNQFFTEEGIHQATVQPEFVDSTSSISSSDNQSDADHIDHLNSESLSIVQTCLIKCRSNSTECDKLMCCKDDDEKLLRSVEIETHAHHHEHGGESSRHLSRHDVRTHEHHHHCYSHEQATCSNVKAQIEITQKPEE